MQFSATMSSMMRKKSYYPDITRLFFHWGRQNWIQQGIRTCAVNDRHEWNCSLPSVSYRWQSFSSTISHIIFLLSPLHNARNQKVCLLSEMCFSVAKSCLTPWTAACQTPLSSIISQSLLKFLSTESVMLSNHLILYCPLFLPPSIFPSIRVFSNKSVLLMRWPKYWSFSFSISPSNEYSGLISFRMDWLDVLAVQGTLKSPLQKHNSKASVLPMNTQDWFPLGWTGWISLQSKRLSRVFSNTTVQKHQFFGAQLSL